MTRQLITIDRARLTTSCGGSQISAPPTPWYTDLQNRVHSQIDTARTGLDHAMPSQPRQPSTSPSRLPSTSTPPWDTYTHCFPTPKSPV